MKFITCIPPDFLGNSKTDAKVFGLRCANHAFIKALLKYGSFGEYHFWIRDEQGVATADNYLDINEKLGSLGDGQRTIRVISPDDIFAALSSNNYSVFHNLEPGLTWPICLRRNFAVKTFPITGVTHTVSGIGIKRILMDVLLSPYRSSDALICPSTSLKEAVQNLFITIKEDLSENWSFTGKDLRLEVIPLGVNVEFYGPRDKTELRKRLGLPGNKVIFTCLTRLTPYDKMELVPLLRAFKEMVVQSKAGGDAFLLIVGQEQAQNYADLLRLIAGTLGIEDRVRVITDCTPEDTPLFYGLSDVFVSPSDHVQETFGLTPLEAMSCGIPAIVSDWDGYRDTVIHGETGFRVPTYWMDCNQEAAIENMPKKQKETYFKVVQSVAVDIPAMTNYMKELLENEQLRYDLGEQARRHIVNNYSWEKIIKRYEEIWEDLNKILASDNEGVRKKSHLYTVPFFEVFGHYPSYVIQPDDEVRSNSRDFPIYDNVIKLIRKDLCQKIFSITSNWTKIEDIYADLHAKVESEQMIIDYHIMVLLKYGVLSVKNKETEIV